jgi:hypothetical protein
MSVEHIISELRDFESASVTKQATGFFLVDDSLSRNKEYYIL